jgi:hypothetical protein
MRERDRCLCPFLGGVPFPTEWIKHGSIAQGKGHALEVRELLGQSKRVAHIPMNVS